MNPISFSRVPFPRGGALLRVALLAAVVALSGCTTVKGWFGGDHKDNPKKAAKLARKPFDLVDFTASATVTRLWTAKAGGGEGRLGLNQGPVVYDGRVFAAAVKGGVSAFDVQTGKETWHFKSDDKISGGPGAGDGLVVVGTLEGAIIAIDAATGTEKWRAKVLSEVISAPLVGQGTVLVHSNDGRVTAFDAADGKRRWFWNHDLPILSVRGNDSPTFGPGLVFVGNDDGKVVTLSLADGTQQWEQSAGSPDGRSDLERMADVDGAPVLDNTTLYASSYKKTSIAIDAPSGRPLWTSEHGGSGRIGVGTDRIVVADPTGVVWALDKSGGSAMWQQAGLTRRNLSGTAVQGDFAVVGDYDGYLHWLRLDNGDFAARVRVAHDAIHAAPVVFDGILVVQTTGGDLAAYRVQ